MKNRPFIQDVVVQAQMTNKLVPIGEAREGSIQAHVSQAVEPTQEQLNQPLFAQVEQIPPDEIIDDQPIEEFLQLLSNDIELANEAAPEIVSLEARQQSLYRLEATIIQLMDKAHQVYQQNAYRSGIWNANYITRLSTNEFFFYTSEPLSLEEFELLQNTLIQKAQTFPSGIQFILGSFAVITSDKKMMNVTPFIRSGQPSDIDFLVKNYTSGIDYHYTQEDEIGGTIKLPMLDSKNADTLPKIWIQGVEKEFQFYNLFDCQTPAGTSYLTGIDVCLDNYYGVAHRNFIQRNRTDPSVIQTPTSQVLIANHGSLSITKVIDKLVLSVDPVNVQFKHGTDNIEEVTCSLPFGSDEVKLFVLPSSPVLNPSDNLSTILRASLSQDLTALGIEVCDTFSDTPFELHFRDQLTFLCTQNYLEQTGAPFVYTQTPFRIDIQPEFFIKEPAISRIERMKYTFTSAQERIRLIHNVQPINNPYKNLSSVFAVFKSRYRQQTASPISLLLDEIKAKIEAVTNFEEFSALEKELQTNPKYIQIHSKQGIMGKFTRKVSSEAQAVKDMLQQKENILENENFVRPIDSKNIT